MRYYSWFAAVAVGLVTSAGAQQATPPADVPAEHPGTVIFSRSVEDGEAPAKQVPATAEVRATDGEREAITFLTYDLAVQISSSLRWTGVRVGGAPVAFSQQAINSDIDHTGALREAVIPLAQPLGPQESLSLDLTYEGTAALSANRLEQIGTPADIAEASDWDRVSEELVGLRGFGNVAWYPVASVPVALGDGAKFFTEAAAERQRQSQATVTMRVTEEFFGEAPNLAVLDGEVLA